MRGRGGERRGGDTIARRSWNCASPSQDCEEPVDNTPEDLDGSLTDESVVALRAEAGTVYGLPGWKVGVRTNQTGTVYGAV